MKQDGFSAVELLITLFIAAIFLAAGYQLWGYVQRAGAEADQLAKASNVAYDYLRREASKPVTECPPTPPNSPTTLIDTTVPTNERGDLPSNTRIKVITSCPSNLTNVKKIESTVTYGSDQKKAIHAIYTK